MFEVFWMLFQYLIWIVFQQINLSEFSGYGRKEIKVLSNHYFVDQNVTKGNILNSIYCQ